MSLRNHEWREIFRVLTKIHGFELKRQKGSHLLLAHSDGRYVTLPRHDPIKIGTLKSILYQAEITQGQFLQDIQKI